VRRLVIALLFTATVAHGHDWHTLGMMFTEPSGAVYDPFPIKTGLVGAWIVPGYINGTNCLDVTTNGNNMILSRAGAQNGTSLILVAASNDYAMTTLTTSTNSSIRQTTSQVSVSFWWSRSGSSWANSGYAWVSLTPSTWASGWLFQSYSSATINWCINNYTNRAAASPAPSLNAWHHYVGTYDGTNQYVYVDGACLGTNAQSAAINMAGNMALRIGVLPTYYSGGTNDTYSLFNRALTPAEITTIYNNGKTYHQ